MTPTTLVTSDSAYLSVMRNGRDTQVDDQYYALVHWIRSIGDMSGVVPKSIGVTSCAGGAGVSTVASSLAVAAARTSEQGVLLLDLSASVSMHANRFDPAADMSLREALGDVSQVAKRVKPSSVVNLSHLSLDSADEGQPLVLDSNRVSELLRALEGEFGTVIVDLPPVESSLCFVAAGSLNGVLLVMEAECTRSEIAARAKQRLIDARASVLGVILNKTPQHIPNWLEARL